MLLKQNSVNTPNNPRAYSKVAMAPISSCPNSTVAPSSGETVSTSTPPGGQISYEGQNALLMSAKDLQVETRPPFMKVVTSLDDGNTKTKSTMV